MNTSTKDLEKRLAQLKREVPTRGFECFPTWIKNLAELPPDLCSPSLQPVAGQRLIVFPPQLQHGRHYVPRQALLFTPVGMTHMFASIWPGEPPQVTCLQGRDLLSMRISLLLLYGCLEITGRGPASPIRLSMEFNTVAWDKLSEPICQFVQASQPRPPTPAAEAVLSAEVQPGVRALPLKFSNGIRLFGLLPGEVLQDLVFQAGVRERLLFLFHRAVLANTLLLLTTNYVSIIQEHLTVAQGWIVSYIPRANISAIHCRPASRWNDITFQLQRDGQSAEYLLRLNESATQAWKAAWEQHGGRWMDL